jgi:hypothetical protein
MPRRTFRAGCGIHSDIHRPKSQRGASIHFVSFGEPLLRKGQKDAGREREHEPGFDDFNRADGRPGLSMLAQTFKLTARAVFLKTEMRLSLTRYFYTMPPKYAAFAFVLLSWVVAWAPDLEAGQRRFTFVYESTTSSKGEVELENWATWKNGRESGNQVAKTQGFLPENLATGRNLLLTRCISCHSLVPIGKFSAQRWPELAASMSERASLNETERAQITAYLVAARKSLPLASAFSTVRSGVTPKGGRSKTANLKGAGPCCRTSSDGDSGRQLLSALVSI